MNWKRSLKHRSNQLLRKPMLTNLWTSSCLTRFRLCSITNLSSTQSRNSRSKSLTFRRPREIQMTMMTWTWAMCWRSKHLASCCTSKTKSRFSNKPSKRLKEIQKRISCSWLNHCMLRGSLPSTESKSGWRARDRALRRKWRKKSLTSTLRS